MKRLLAVLVLVLSGCGQVWYPRLGLYKNVVSGGQAQIDAGRVVDVDGLPGIWLAGHRTTHGAVFNRLPGARVGDQVCAYRSCYRVVRIVVVPQNYRVTAPLGDVVLQCSVPGGALLVVANRV